MKLSKVLTIALAVAVAAPAAMATCIPAKQFTAFVNSTTNSPIQLDPASKTAATGMPQFLGLLWQSDDSTINNFAAATTTCRPVPPQVGGWLLAGGPVGPNAIIAGGLNQNNNCTGLSGCPAGSLTVLLEEPSADDSDAFVVIVRVDETAPPNYNFLTLAPNYAEIAFPRARVVTSNRGVSDVVIDWRLPNADANFTGKDAGGTLSADSTINNYILYEADSDAGRDASMWNEVARVAYVSSADGSQTGYSVDCSNEAVDKFYAVGLELAGGAAGVDTQLVGAATQIECDPNLAEPDQRRKPRTIQDNPKNRKSR